MGDTTYYLYDEAGQLREAYNSLGGTYTEYDNGGNVIYKYLIWEDHDINCFLEKELDFVYANENWPDLLTSVNGVPITYDAIGNPLSYDGKTYTWTSGRELASITSADMSLSFKYNDSGLRTHKSVTQNGVTTTYTYAWSQDGRLISQSDGTTTLYFVYDENGEIIGFSKLTASSNELYYYVKNLQGDVCAIVDCNGSVVAEYIYDAWGYLINISGSQAIILGTLNPIRYRGYYYDTETGYYYLQSRYYDPLWGRFINGDEMFDLNFDCIGVNLFIYCGNSPLIFRDYTGFNSLNLREKIVIAMMADKQAKEIVEHWIIGDGETKNINDKNEWNTYLNANKKIKEVIFKYTMIAVFNFKSSYTVENLSISISDTGMGGYFTGYDLLNGSNISAGGFDLYIKSIVIKGEKIIVKGKYIFNDIVDPNEAYSSDILYYNLMKLLILKKGHGNDYNIHITCSFAYEINFSNI